MAFVLHRESRMYLSGSELYPCSDDRYMRSTYPDPVCTGKMNTVHHQVSKWKVDRWVASEIIRDLFTTQMRTV